MSKNVLSARQMRAIELMLTPMSMTNIANEVGVTSRQLSRWRNEPAFISALQSAQADASRRAIAISAGALVTAARTSAHLAEFSEDESTRLRAAQVVVQIFAQLSEHHELEQRITALEAVTDGK